MKPHKKLFLGLLFMGVVCSPVFAQSIPSEPLSVMTRIGLWALATGILWAFLNRNKLTRIYQGLGFGFFGMSFLSPEVQHYYGFAYFEHVVIAAGITCWLVSFYIHWHIQSSKEKTDAHKRSTKLIK